MQPRAVAPPRAAAPAAAEGASVPRSFGADAVAAPTTAGEPFSPLRTRAGSLAAGASPTPSEALSPDGQALHDRIVALQQRLSKSLVAHGEGTPRS